MDDGEKQVGSRETHTGNVPYVREPHAKYDI
jgi:hypothetical protein